jgi:hypothetical protein
MGDRRIFCFSDGGVSVLNVKFFMHGWQICFIHFSFFALALSLVIGCAGKQPIKGHSVKAEMSVEDAKEYLDSIDKMAPVAPTGLTSLDPAVAGVLAARQGELDLSDVTDLSVDTARILAEHSGPLLLCGMKRIQEDVAIELSKHNGLLNLAGITVVDHRVAIQFSRHKGDLRLNGVKEISYEAAKALTKHDGVVELFGLNKELPRKTKSILLQNKQILLEI